MENYLTGILLYAALFGIVYGIVWLIAAWQSPIRRSGDMENRE